MLDLRLGYTEARGTKALRATLAYVMRRRPPTTFWSRPARSRRTTCSSTRCSSRRSRRRGLPRLPAALCRGRGDRLRCLPLGAASENDFRYDLDELERLVRADTKMIVVNTPHNPTGAILTPEELDEVYELAGAVGAWLLCDEAYRWLDFPGSRPMAPPIRNKGRTGSASARCRNRSACRVCGSAGSRPRPRLPRLLGLARLHLALAGPLERCAGQIAIQHRDAIVIRNQAIAAREYGRGHRLVRRARRSRLVDAAAGRVAGVAEVQPRVPSQKSRTVSPANTASCSRPARPSGTKAICGSESASGRISSARADPDGGLSPGPAVEWAPRADGRLSDRAYRALRQRTGTYAWFTP